MCGILLHALRNKGCHPSQARAGGWQAGRPSRLAAGTELAGSHAITIALRLRTKLLKQVK